MAEVDTPTRTKDPHAITVSPHQGPRSSVLARAAECVLKDRQELHGPPEDSFKDIAEVWEWYKGVKFRRVDVTAMLGLLKYARGKRTPTYKDNWADIAGYAACAFEAALADEKEKDVELSEALDENPLDPIKEHPNG